MKKITALFLALTMILSVVMLAACSKKEEEPTTFESGEAHFQYVADKEVDKIKADVLKNYEGTEERGEADKKYEADVKILFRPELISLLSTFTQKLNINLSFLKSLELKGTLNNKGDLFGADFGLLFNDVSLFDGKLYADAKEGDAAVRLPILTEDWLKFDAEKIKDALGGILKKLPVSNVGFSAAPDAGSVVTPNKETVENLIDRYVKIILDSIKDVTEGEEERTVGSVTETFVTVQFNVAPATLITIAKNVLTSLKGDADVKKIVEDTVKSIPVADDDDEEGEEGGSGNEKLVPYEEFTKSIDEALEKLGKMTEEDKKDLPTIDLKVYTDKMNVTKAIKADAVSGGDSIGLFLCALEKDGKYAFECTADVKKGENSRMNIAITSDGTVKDGKITTDYVLSYNGEKTVTLKVENLDKEALKDGCFFGKISLNLGEVISFARKLGVSGDKLAMIGTVLGAMNISLTGTGNKDDRKVVFSAATANGELIAVECSLKTSTADNIEKAADAKAFEDEIKNVDTQGLLGKLTEKIKEAGVPQELIDAIPNLLGGLFGGASQGYDDNEGWDD